MIVKKEPTYQNYKKGLRKYHAKLKNQAEGGRVNQDALARVEKLEKNYPELKRSICTA